LASGSQECRLKVEKQAKARKKEPLNQPAAVFHRSIFTRFAENGAGSNCQRLLSVIDAFPLPDVPLVQFRIKAPDVGFWGAKQKSSARLDHCRFLTRGVAD
jgi:hypothetical protein